MLFLDILTKMPFKGMRCFGIFNHTLVKRTTCSSIQALRRSVQGGVI